MKAPTEVELAFDPAEAGLVSFTTEMAKVIWCCIRKQHFVDQHFDAQVFRLAESLNKKMPKNYEAFKQKVCRSGLNVYGTHWVNPGGLSSFGHGELDDEFWQGVWEYLTGQKTLTITQLTFN